MQVHWGYPDPSLAPEAERPRAFEETRQALSARMKQLVALAFERLSDAELVQALQAIARD